MINWTVGIITSPRKSGYYLDQTLNSIKEFSNITIFAEPDSIIPPDFSGNLVKRPKKYGDWTNWATALYELLLSNPDSDYYLMLEDDAILCQCKAYLEEALPKLRPFSSVSLYTPSIYHKHGFKGFHNELHDDKTWSTVTVLMERKQVISFFCDQDVQRHRFEDIFDKPDKYWCCPHTSPRNSIKDAVLGKWAGKEGLPIYYHTPSLAEHIGDQSTLTDAPSTIQNGRKSKDFVGTETIYSESYKIQKSNRIKL